MPHDLPVGCVFLQPCLWAVSAPRRALEPCLGGLVPGLWSHFSGCCLPGCGRGLVWLRYLIFYGSVDRGLLPPSASRSCACGASMPRPDYTSGCREWRG